MRALSNRLARRWRLALIGGVVTACATLWIAYSGTLGPWLEALSHDLLFRFRGETPVSGAVIAAMDEPSYESLGQKPGQLWDRKLHARFIREALQLGARGVVFDVWFADPSPDPAADAQLLESLHAAPGRVVLAAKLHESIHGGTQQVAVASDLLPPAPALAAAAPYGVVNLPLDSDGRVRRHYTNAQFTPLAWRAAERMGRAPADPQAARWIQFYGPIPRKSYRDVLQGTNAFPVGYFSNQVVFVGHFPISTPGGSDLRDVVHTAASRWQGEGTPGVEAQATIYLNLIHGDWLTRWSRPAELAALLFSGWIIGFGLTWLRPWVAVWVAPLLALLVAGAALVLMNTLRLSFPWLLISAVPVPCAFLWALLIHTRGLVRDKEELQRQLATAIHQGARPPAPSRTPVIADFRLIRHIGGGAYGDVWLVRDLVGNFRAAKAVYRDRFPRPEPYEREFRGIEKFSPISRTHPGWVDILHIGRLAHDEGFYYIMEAGDDETEGARMDPERYAARTLAGDLQRRRRLPLIESVTVSLALTDALVHLHRHSLIHRDIKPSNVIFVNGAPKFADIGLVTDFGGPDRDVSFLGTEGYIAPEGPGTPMADLFSLGKLIYEIASGRDRRAFPELPTELEQGPGNPALEELYRIVLKCCEFEVRHRYPTAAALHADLQRLHDQMTANQPAPAERSGL